MDQFDDHRFETFKMPNSSLSGSHSRNSSVSLSVSASVKSHNSLELAPSKRNSHHRRRSSVSTRHESAELMGVTVAELTPSPSRDSFNLGEKDSIRQKALWALEGKPDASYIKVEIPELSTAEIDSQLMFDFPTKPSFPPGTGVGFGSGISSKRDSFKLLSGTLASEERLGTLLEEEEEDSDSEAPPSTPAFGPNEPATPISPDAMSPAQTVVVPQRTRPANLNLRPLSLTPESLHTAIAAGLPTPSSGPSNVSPRPGLKSLSLLANPVDDATKSAMVTHDAMPKPAPVPRRPTLNLQISSESLASSVTCVSSGTPSSASEDGKSSKVIKRSSISYKCSQPTSTLAGLPTPEMTPTFQERRYSGNSVGSLSSRSSLSSSLDFATGSGDEDSVHSAPSFSRMPSKHRALSVSEQHFLFKSHNALLARITDLERALSVRRRESYGFSPNSDNSRPVSTTSDVSSNSAAGEPIDEMLRLVADLKAERDELKRDVDGWRTRVGDLEKQIGVFTKRVDNERRDAWVARSRVGLLEVEKGSLLKDVEAKESLIAELTKLVESLEEQKRVLVEEAERLTAQNEQLRLEKGDVEKEVERWRRKCELLKDESSLATPTPLTTRSFESSKMTFVLGPVQKRGGSQDDAELSEEDNGLANYEDEEEGDMSFHGSSSSLGSLQDYQETTAQPARSLEQAEFQFPVHTHQSQASLSKTWTFPKQVKAPTSDLQTSDSVDRFFGCLDSSRSESADSSLSSDNYSYDRGKDLFATALKNVTDDDAPFFLPRGIGGPAVSPSSTNSSLSSVTEEDEEEEVESDRLTVVEEDEDMFGEVGGIKITFTPPQDEASFEVDPEPVVEPVTTSIEPQDEGDRMRSFTFGKPSVQSNSMITPPKSVPRATAPSAIPRYSPSSQETVVTPPKLNNPRFGAPTSSPSTTFVTPPTKRGGITPSFIPQPITPPSPQRSSSQDQVPTRITFIRQPQRRSLMGTNGVVSQAQNSANAERDMNNRFSPSRFFGNSEFSQTTGRAQVAPIDLNDNTFDKAIPTNTPEYQAKHINPTLSSSSPSSSPLTSFMSSRISSLQTFTSMIPLPWSSPTSRPVNGQADHIRPASAGQDDTFVNQALSPRSTGNTAQDRGSLRRGYVSKDTQLEKLKVRLSRETLLSKADRDQTCKKCVDELVFL